MSLTLLEQARKEGNAAFGSGDYERAAKIYSCALDEEKESRRVKKEEVLTEGVVIEEIEDDEPEAENSGESKEDAAAPAAAAAEEKKKEEEGLQPASTEVLQLRAVLLSNLAAARIKQESWEAAAAAATEAIETGVTQNEKALERRAHAYSRIESKWDKALSDYKELLEKCPSRRDVADNIRELDAQIAARNEKVKTEMIGKLKEWGNFCLKPFGLSTDSFEMVPNGEGGYSLNMKNGSGDA